MSTKDDSVYLRHILDAITKVEEYLGGVDAQTFTKNTLVQDGVIRQLQIVGEATRPLSSELRNRYPHIPWQDIAGMRNKLVHDYFGVDLQAVWLTTRRDLPVLKEGLQIVLKELASA